MSHICSFPGCGKESKLQCPTCLKLELPAAYFCSKECFSKAWKTHKIIHEVEEYKRMKSLDPMFHNFKFAGDIRPGKISPIRPVDEDIERPDYADKKDGSSLCEETENRFAIEIKNEKQIEGMREACRVAREVLDIAGEHVKVGVTGEELDIIVHEACMQRKVYPSPLNYYLFPKSVCVSVNEIVCHGIPDSRPLEDGDIVNLDVTIYKDGFHGDVNETYFVGNVDETSIKLVEATYESLRYAISKVKPGMKAKDIGNYISDIIDPTGFKVDKHYCGHGIGRLFHCNPTIQHFRNNKTYGVIKEGMTFTIEPMVNEGNSNDMQWPDNWTVSTTDGKRSAQFEHTLLVTKHGCEVLTASPKYYSQTPTELLPFDKNMFQR
ncbi:hypothetical protein WA158_003584 [Blastocystis sp. Blastoise]